MKKYILMLSLLAVAFDTVAQENRKPEYIKFKNGAVLTFDKANIEKSDVIFGEGGAQDSLGIKIYMKDGSCRDYLYSQIFFVAFVEQGGGQTDDKNMNRNGEYELGRNREAWRLEFPRLHQGNEDFTYEITHYADADSVVNFSLEWDGEKLGNRWTCYELYETNLAKNVKRKDNFREDPKITNPAHRTTLAQYSATSSTYSRGHLCPSGDRLASRQQNDQTFYLSNMQPQATGHNSGVWSQLEGKVRAYATAADCDTLYIVKAATIDKAEDISEVTAAGLRVPKYFYMALLSYDKAKDKYHALGIWSPHYKGSTTEYITIRELEERTGIDFFCNLPDETENAVEADRSDDNARYWGITFSSTQQP